MQTAPSLEPRCDPPESLLKYDSPLFAGFEPKTSEMEKMKATQKSATGDASASQLDDMVNAMLPPREWTQESGTWMQYVSKEPATRLDVITLQEQLDKRLLERQARETGICPVREDLYSQCFDELIRQVTLDGPERGLLLLRVRDEIRMTIAAYQTLYESSIAFGMRKVLSDEKGRRRLEIRKEKGAHGGASQGRDAEQGQDFAIRIGGTLEVALGAGMAGAARAFALP